MERLGSLGVHTLEELQTFSSRVTSAQRRKRHLAEQLPHAPGVYLFRDDARPGPLRRHVPRPPHAGAHLLHGLRDAFPHGRDGRRSPRRVTGHRVRHAPRGRGPRAPTDRRAQAALQPAVPVPRASALDQAHRRAVAPALAGPAGARRRRRLRRPVRLQTHRRASPRRPARDVPDPSVRRPHARRPSLSACVLAEMGRCLSPCNGACPPMPTPLLSNSLRDVTGRRPDAVVVVGRRRGWRRWRKRERFEDAGSWRDRLAAFLRGAARTQRLQALTRCPESRRCAPRGRRLGRPRRPPRPARGCRRHPSGCPCRATGSRQLRASAETVVPGPGPTPAATAEETEKSCGGSSPTVSGSSASTGSGPARSGAPPSTSACTTRPTSRGTGWCLSRTDAASVRSAPAGPLALRP